MKNIEKSVAVALLGMGLLVTQTVQAQSNPLVMQVTMTANVQATTVTNRDSAIYRTTKVKIGNKELLQLLGAATTNDFSGASLVIANKSQGIFQVVNGTTVLADVSSFFTLDGSTNYVITGSASDKTSTYNVKYSWIKTITFNDGRGNSFTLSGNEIDVLKAGPVRQGHQTFTESNTLKGVGEGKVGGMVGMFSGTIKMSRKTTS